MRLREK
jgi:chromosome segregation ATPase